VLSLPNATGSDGPMAIDPKDLSIHDEVLVETEIDGASVGLPSFVTNALGDELWLALRLPDPRLNSLVPGQRLHLTFDRGGSLVVETEFLRRLGGTKLGSEKSRVFSVRRPQGVDTVQRRAHVRVDLERAVRIKSFGALGGEKIGNGRTVNIGAGGVQFTTDMPLMFGDQLRLALVLTPREIVVAGGPIVRIDEIPVPARPGVAAPAQPAMLTRVAVRFDKITEQDQERITVHILAAFRSRTETAQPQPAPLPAQPQPARPEADPTSPKTTEAAELSGMNLDSADRPA
jgi:hypothetical protein